MKANRFTWLVCKDSELLPVVPACPCSVKRYLFALHLPTSWLSTDANHWKFRYQHTIDTCRHPENTASARDRVCLLGLENDHRALVWAIFGACLLLDAPSNEWWRKPLCLGFVILFCLRTILRKASTRTRLAYAKTQGQTLASALLTRTESSMMLLNVNLASASLPRRLV